MSTPQYKVLERFSEEARRKVAERVFDRPIVTAGNLYPSRYACADGLCIMAALLKADGKPTKDTHPEPGTIARKLGTKAIDNICDIGSITHMNDTGALATPAAVRELLLGGDDADRGGRAMTSTTAARRTGTPPPGEERAAKGEESTDGR